MDPSRNDFDRSPQDAASPTPDPAAARAPGSAVPASGERPHLVRCPAHGLLYDASRASGCTRCAGVETVRRGLVPKLRARPRLWLGAGLALALLLGSLPAAFYAASVKDGPLLEQRIEAEAIRRGRVGDAKTRQAYAEARDRVSRTRSRGIAFSALLWLGTGALLLFGWIRFV